MAPTIRAAVLVAGVVASATSGGVPIAAAQVYTIFQIVTASLPDAYPGEPYTASIDTVLGSAPLTWRYFVGNFGVQCDDPSLFGLTLDTPSATVNTSLHGDIPIAAAAGVATFCIGASSTTSGATPIQTITLRVRDAGPSAQPPVEIVAVRDRQVTVRWAPPGGTSPLGYRLEGGPSPAAMIAAVDLPPSTPTATFELPGGVWYLRVSNRTAQGLSAPSAATRLALETSEFPPAPAGLTAAVSGHRVALSWASSLNAGQLTGAVLDITGTLNGLVTVTGTDGWQFDHVPAGTYSVAVRGRTGAAAGAPSSPVVVEVPGPCPGVPQTPERLLVVVTGGVVRAIWDTPAAGPAVEGYVVNVAGRITGAFPVGLTRVHAAVLPAGVYAVAVSATNACGASPMTAAVTVDVR